MKLSELDSPEVKAREARDLPDSDLSSAETGTPESRPLVPTNQAHWESQKTNIEKLYVQKNLILKNVIDIMLEEHNFKATARMYKRQFTKWEWKKYNKPGNDPATVVAPRGARPKVQGPAPAKITRPRARQASQLVSANVASVARLLFENEGSYQFENILNSYSEYISGWGEAASPWRSGAARPQEFSILQNFRAALDHFDRDDNEAGGIALRRAFRQVEDVVTDQNIEAIWDCCLAVPQLALSLGRRDILLIFVKYLNQLASVKLRGHPLGRIARNMQKIAEDDPDQLQNYVARAWKLWVDNISRDRGREDPVTIHLKRGYVILMKPELSIVGSLIGEFAAMARTMLAELGEERTTATILELENLLVRMYIPLLSAETRARADAILNGLLLRLEHDPKNKGVPIGMWDWVDRYLSFSAHNFLASIADFTGDFKKAEAHRAMILTAPKDGFWMQTAVQLEKYLRDEGRLEEADAIARQRLEEPEPLGHGTFV
ncbi:hypothetical protein GQ53DRAFT_833404 [Thozetella sp. PMI_491]|nr:hypothetical protein GQ53DRAFT_833404 [Thozetella sp. PMI_491]